MQLQLTGAKSNFTERPLSSLSSSLAKVFLKIASLETFIIIIASLIIIWGL